MTEVLMLHSTTNCDYVVGARSTPSDASISSTLMEHIVVVKANGHDGSRDESTDPSVPVGDMEDLPILTVMSDAERYFGIVRASPDDFDAWAVLLDIVEQDNNEDCIKAAYDEFLTLYPYCHGYWKKYADLSLSFGGDVSCRAVYERAVAAFPRSVDLWVDYVAFAAEMHIESSSHIRALFARGEALLTHEWHSAPFWDAYAGWEAAQGNIERVFQLYDRILRVPFDQCTGRIIDRITDMATSHPPKSLLTEAEFAAETTAAREAHPGETDAAIESHVRQRVLALRRQVAAATDMEAAKRRRFELLITRTFFQVRALADDQLDAWRTYLDFEEREGSEDRVVHLYERCVVVCALYDEFWIRYARRASAMGKVDAARAIYVRAGDIHLRKRHSVHVARAQFEESLGNVELAKAAFARLDTLSVSADAVDRRANFERRVNGFQAAIAVYDTALARLGDMQPRVSAYMGARRAGVQLRSGNVSACKASLRGLIERFPDSKHVYVRLLDVELNHGDASDRVSRVVGVFDLVAHSTLPLDTKCGFAVRRAEFLDDEGMSVVDVLESDARLQRLTASIARPSDCRAKRTLVDMSGADSHYGDACAPPGKAVRYAPPPATPVAMAAVGAGYGQQQAYVPHNGMGGPMRNGPSAFQPMRHHSFAAQGQSQSSISN